MPPHQGGLEIVADTLFKGLQERNHQIRWISSSSPLQPGVEGDLIRVSAFKSLEDILHVPLPLWGPLGFRDLFRLCKWADIVHVHDCLYPSSMMAILFARSLSKPSVITQHIALVPYGPMLSLTQKIAYRAIGRLVLNSATAITTVSAHIAPYFHEIGVRKPIELIRMGFDDQFNPSARQRKVEFRRKYGLNNAGPIVLFVGRLVPKKGIADVIVVQKGLSRLGYTLVVAGDGALAHLLRTSPRTVHIPQVTHESMHEIYGLADVLFLPSYGEGLPLTLLEALLCGLPAVVSDDISYVANLAKAPGIWICSDLSTYRDAIVNAHESGIDSDVIAVWAQHHFSRSKFLDLIERLYYRLQVAQNTPELP